MTQTTTEASNWSCDERDRENCRNGHGCHCAEIDSLIIARSKTSDGRLEIIAALYKAWPNAEDMDGTDQGVIGLIEQLTAERDAARQALAEIVQGRPGWREAARRASEAMVS